MNKYIPHARERHELNKTSRPFSNNLPKGCTAVCNRDLPDTDADSSPAYSAAYHICMRTIRARDTYELLVSKPKATRRKLRCPFVTKPPEDYVLYAIAANPPPKSRFSPVSIPEDTHRKLQ